MGTKKRSLGEALMQREAAKRAVKEFKKLRKKQGDLLDLWTGYPELRALALQSVRKAVFDDRECDEQLAAEIDALSDETLADSYRLRLGPIALFLPGGLASRRFEIEDFENKLPEKFSIRAPKTETHSGWANDLVKGRLWLALASGNELDFAGDDALDELHSMHPKLAQAFCIPSPTEKPAQWWICRLKEAEKRFAVDLNALSQLPVPLGESATEGLDFVKADFMLRSIAARQYAESLRGRARALKLASDDASRRRALLSPVIYMLREKHGWAWTDILRLWTDAEDDWDGKHPGSKTVARYTSDEHARERLRLLLKKDHAKFMKNVASELTTG